MLRRPPRKKVRLTTEQTSTTSLSNDLEESSLRVSKLCSRCQRIDFKALFCPQWAIPPILGTFIMAIDQLQVDPRCDTCRLLQAVAPRWDSGSSGFHLRIFDGRRLSGNAQGIHRSQSTTALSLLPGQATSPSLTTIRECQDRGLVLAKYGHNGKLGLGIALEGAFVNRSRINFDKLKAWLLQCELQHKDMCAVGTARPLSLPLSCIDCRNRSVVPVLESDQYLALSYVWGTNRSSTCRTAQQDMEYLPLNGISQVIEDAISTVISLGKRYLWVDQYCINQLDPRIKEIQIQDMDSVYAGAYATIVACAGSDANYGLPGISRDRDLQPSATFHDFELFSSLPGLGTAVKSTKWATRGWTYQEAVLSHRILFFTDKQVYFVCPNMARSEAEVVHDNAAHDRIRLERMGMSLNSGMFRDGYRSRNRSHLAELDDHIAEFSGRCLTYQGDALDAFRGLLTRSLFFTYYGVPIAPAANTHHSEHPEVFDFAMARGLNWKPTILNTTQGARSTFARRREFPSWSWAGWVGPVDYPSSFFVVPEPEVCDIKFWVEDENKKLSSLFHIASSLQKTRMIPEQSHVLVVDAHLFRVRFKEDVTEDGYMRDYWCYPALTEGEQVESWHPDRDKKASFFENPDRTTELFHRIVSETWDGMVLWTRGRYAHLRILDWVGDVAHVIGHAQLRFRGRGYWKFTGSQRKRIRLV